MAGIEYNYEYDEINKVYKVWREDGESLNGFIPNGLFKQLVISSLENDGEMIFVNSIKKAKHFSRDGKRGFIDLNERKFSRAAIESILSDSTEEETQKKSEGFKRVLSIFKNKKN